MDIILKTQKTYQLDRNTITNICKLKKKHWMFSLAEQQKWFKKNIKKRDIHNLCYYNGILVGYTALRLGYYTYGGSHKKKKFFAF